MATLQTRIVTTNSYTIVPSDEVIFVNSTVTSATILLPTGAAGDEGRTYYIKDYSGQSKIHPITITDGARLINGVSFAILNGAYSEVQVVSDGSNWFTI